MVESVILDRYRRSRHNLIDLDEDIVLALRKAVAYSSKDVLHKRALKAIDFLYAKLLSLNPAYRDCLQEVKLYAIRLNSYKSKKNDLYNSLLLFLDKCMEDAKRVYESVLLDAMATYLKSLYHEHFYTDAYLLELSSVFYTAKNVKELEMRFESLKEIVITSIDNHTKELRDEMAMQSYEPEHPNTEFLRYYGSKRIKKDKPKREKNANAKAIKQYSERKKNRCQRVRVKAFKNEISILKAELSKIDDEHLRRYYYSLFADIRDELEMHDANLKPYFDTVIKRFESLKMNELSKRNFEISLKAYPQYASITHSKAMKLIKLIFPTLILSLDKTVKDSHLKLIFDRASGDKSESKRILERELMRIDQTKEVSEYCKKG